MAWSDPQSPTQLPPTAETAREGALFQPLVPDGKAVTFPIEDLDEGAAAVEKQKQRAGQQPAGKGGLDQGAQALEALAHVDGLIIQVNRLAAGRTHRSHLFEQGEDIAQQGGIESALHMERNPVALQAQTGAAGTKRQLDKAAGGGRLWDFQASAPVEETVITFGVLAAPSRDAQAAAAPGSDFLGPFLHKG